MSKLDSKYDDEVFVMHELVSQLDMLTLDDTEEVTDSLNDLERSVKRTRQLVRKKASSNEIQA